MTKIKLLAYYAIMALTVLSARSVIHAADHQALKIRVAIIDFDSGPVAAGWQHNFAREQLGQIAASGLATELARLGSFEVIERSRIQEVLSEQDFQAGGRVDRQTAVQLGKLLGTPLVIVGEIREFEMKTPMIRLGRGISGGWKSARTTVSARLVNTETGKILAVADGKARVRGGAGNIGGIGGGVDLDTSKLSKLFNKAVTSLAADLATKANTLDPAAYVTCKVAKIAQVMSDGAVALNVGQASKIKAGDHFEIRKLGQVIRDPDSGALLGYDEMPVGTVKISKVSGPSLSFGKPLDGSGYSAGAVAIQTGAPGTEFRCMEIGYEVQRYYEALANRAQTTSASASSK